MKGGTLQINWHGTQPVLTLDFHPISGILATGGADYDIKLWLIASEEGEKKVPTATYQNSLSYHGSAINAIRFSPSGDLLASGADGGELIIWKLHISDSGQVWKVLKTLSYFVGPNGSGKSNVIDAMLFVFGKRAKQMRLNKVSELIHNSTNHQNLNSARVSVHFQEIIDLDDENYEVVPGTDFVIAREAFRDNSSKYYINGRDSKFTEVTKKLKGKGVDLDNNRFLILQGEVEQISLMKPKAQNPHDEGFLEYLEDIIGTNKYLEKIDESHKQLEALNEKRSGVVQMVKLADKERESLESVKNEAEDYMLKELSLLKWQEKAVKFASEDNATKMEEIQKTASGLQENLTSERANAQQPKLFVGMILILIFAEALALYGLIVGIILSSRAGQSRAD